MSIKVLINPGHDSNIDSYGCPIDPGAVNREYGLCECDIALDIGQKVADFLKQAGGYEVAVLQQDNLNGEAGPYAYSVCAQANFNHFDYVISIHCNAGGGTGTETLIWDYGTEAEAMARCIQNKIVELVGTRDRDVLDRFRSKRNLAILRETVMPACLVETAFMDSDDIYLLMDEDTKDLFAKAIAIGFTDFIAAL